MGMRIIIAAFIAYAQSQQLGVEESAEVFRQIDDAGDIEKGTAVFKQRELPKTLAEKQKYFDDLAKQKLREQGSNLMMNQRKTVSNRQIGRNVDISSKPAARNPENSRHHSKKKAERS